MKHADFLKNEKNVILLQDILELFDKVFKYILSELKTLFIIANRHNIKIVCEYEP